MSALPASTLDRPHAGQSGHNAYWRWTKTGWAPVDVLAAPTFGRGEDFYVDVFARIERSGELKGYRFLLAEYMPASLPFTGRDVVLVVVCDEHYRYPPWLADIHAVIRPLGRFPQYREGLPLTRAKLLSLVHFLSKRGKIAIDMLRSAIRRRDPLFPRVARRVRHIPLPCYFRFDPTLRPVEERTIDFAFLGSIDYDASHRRLLHRLLMPPKIATRLEMVAAATAYAQRSSAASLVKTTGDFEQSVQSPDQYVAALQNCRISICPRGSNYETYRLTESLKAGCIVVGDPLPRAWFYENHPGIVLDGWAQLPDVLGALLADPARMATLARQSREHWERCFSEDAIAREITRFVTALD